LIQYFSSYFLVLSRTKEKKISSEFGRLRVTRPALMHWIREQ
jgi:hypothetical protein